MCYKQDLIITNKYHETTRNYIKVNAYHDISFILFYSRNAIGNTIKPEWMELFLI